MQPPAITKVACLRASKRRARRELTVVTIALGVAEPLDFTECSRFQVTLQLFRVCADERLLSVRGTKLRWLGGVRHEEDEVHGVKGLKARSGHSVESVAHLALRNLDYPEVFHSFALKRLFLCVRGGRWP